MSMKRSRKFLIGALCLVAIYVVYITVSVLSWFVGEILYQPIDFGVVAEFRELPPTDDELKQWLVKQPGVYIGLVQRHGNTVSLIWGHTHRRLSDPITPAVRDEFERFGCKGLVSYAEEKDYRDK
jgi:hypothetical protein